MTESLKGIIIGTISSLMATGIIYILGCNATLPLWIWLASTTVLVLLIFITKWIVKKRRIKNFISEFTECSLGNSYVYTWKYRRSKHGIHSVYGYEAIDIHTQKPLNEMNNEKTITFGHEVPDETIKIFIQLVMIANIDKKMGEKLKPVLDYLNWIEDSQKHQLLH